MSKNQSQTETTEQSQEPNKDTNNTNILGAVASQPHRLDSRNTIRQQPIRLAEVVSARFARRD